MKLENKHDQNILEVLQYEDGPQVYGFIQDDQHFLAVKQNETDDGNSSWLMVPLTKEDKGHYEALRQNLISVQDFIKERPNFTVTFNCEGDLIHGS